VFILWGNNAKKKRELIKSPNHLVIESSHPSPLGARHSFFGSKCFSRSNAFLKENNREEVDFTLSW
jgi:uracil-DNA glycosylase